MRMAASIFIFVLRKLVVIDGVCNNPTELPSEL
jgi:hypothetical protein